MPARTPACLSPLLLQVRRLAPWHLRQRGSFITVTCAVFSQQGEVLASYNDENVYLFRAQGQAPAAASGAAVPTGSGDGGARQGSKRLRGSTGGVSGSEGSGAARQTAAARAARSQQRRGAAAAALAQAESQRAASGAAAAAEAHASVRRGLLGDEADAQLAPRQSPLLLPLPTAGDAGVGRQADASWLARLPQPRGSSQQQQQEQGPGQHGGAAWPSTPAEASDSEDENQSEPGVDGRPKQGSGGRQGPVLCCAVLPHQYAAPAWSWLARVEARALFCPL